MLMVGVLSACGDATGSSAGAKPNIVLLVADDLGWDDVSYHGSEIATPNIDRLAAEGVVLDRFYAAPVCSPTRMGLLTGRYPMRWGMMDSAIRPWETLGLPPGEITLPELLAGAGYATRVLLGKWHAGHGSRVYHPLENGFTGFFGFYNGGIDYFTQDIAGQPDWHRDFEPTDVRGRYTTDLITDEAVRVIAEAAATGRPFFLSVDYNAPHTPLGAPEACRSRTRSIEDPSRALYAAVVSCLDDGVARVIAALDDAGLRDDTLVWFLSDNGGHEAFGARNDPLRGGKLEVYEGGIRVPSIVRWPAGGLAGGATVAAPIAYVDMMPTLARLAGVTEPLPAALDGGDVLDVLRGGAGDPERELFSFVGPNLVTGPEGPDSTALMRGRWKLVRTGPNLLVRPDAPGVLELFDLESDPGEARDLAAIHPDVVAQLLARTRELRSLQPAEVTLSPLSPPAGWMPPLLWRVPDA